MRGVKYLDCYGVDNALVSYSFLFPFPFLFRIFLSLGCTCHKEFNVNRYALEIQLFWVISLIRVWLQLLKLFVR